MDEVHGTDGEACDDLVFRYNRFFERDDSTLELHEYNPIAHVTVRTTFVGNERVRVDLYRFRMEPAGGIPVSRPYRTTLSTERVRSDIPKRYRRHGI